MGAIFLTAALILAIVGLWIAIVMAMTGNRLDVLDELCQKRPSNRWLVLHIGPESIGYLRNVSKEDQVRQIESLKAEFNNRFGIWLEPFEVRVEATAVR